MSGRLCCVSFWEHQKPVHRNRAVAIDAIARESVALLDTGGLRALTIRAVASRLDVAAPSLYSRISSVDDLFDLALDHALGQDTGVERCLEGSSIFDLLIAVHRHLCRHRWACQVIGFRAPRGPNYLRLSERMIILLTQNGVPDPVGTAAAASNFVIGSALTSPVATDEHPSPINPDVAPHYADLYAEHPRDPGQILAAGLTALLEHDSNR
ncbi:TetR/AcrR family transcriptional regulator [Nesterenkonia ebinurensis]|uniref:TetR/AcrR family transcriptional regulator n=1 Tax=Nesterenkonia ebinurensis TaxID=2608252 RepID=UPI001CC53CCE|nr:TetR/AcrR family transcriptional regulator [Nesterenkonia ebinurensis]